MFGNNKLGLSANVNNIKINEVDPNTLQNNQQLQDAHLIRSLFAPRTTTTTTTSAPDLVSEELEFFNLVIGIILTIVLIAAALRYFFRLHQAQQQRALESALEIIRAPRPYPRSHEDA